MSNLSHDSMEFMARIQAMPRHLICDAYDDAMDMLLERARASGFSTIRYDFPTGYDCGSWVVPEKWTLHSARLYDLDGKVLIDAEDNGLSCMSYSMPFSGKVSREELFEHLHTHENIADAVPFAFSYYSKSWGLCCSTTLKNTLNDDEYIVEIDSEFSAGTMSVGEVVLEGKLDESFLLVSHLCHPYQINDGPMGAVLGLDVLKNLRKVGVNYTIRQLIVPETIGSAAWLSRNANSIPLLRGGLFAEMLTIDLPFVLNYSFMNESMADRLFAEIVRKEKTGNKCECFNYGNDERQFNGPGVCVPMQALHRSNMSRYQEGRYDAYPEYHSDFDNMDLVDEAKLIRALELVYNLVYSFDTQLVVPVPLFKGEPFLTRYQLQLDDLSDFGMFMDVVNLTGRGLTIYEIAKKMEMDGRDVLCYLMKLVDVGLLEFQAVDRGA